MQVDEHHLPACLGRHSQRTQMGVPPDETKTTVTYSKACIVRIFMFESYFHR